MEYICLYQGEIPEYIKYIQNDISRRLEEETITINEKLTVYFVPLKELPGNDPSYRMRQWPVISKNDNKSIYIYIIDPDATCDRIMITDEPKYFGFLTDPKLRYELHRQLVNLSTILRDAKDKGMNFRIFYDGSLEVMVCMGGMTIYGLVKKFVEDINSKFITWQMVLATNSSINEARESIKNSILKILTSWKGNAKIITHYKEHNLDPETVRMIEVYNLLIS